MSKNCCDLLQGMIAEKDLFRFRGFTVLNAKDAGQTHHQTIVSHQDNQHR